MGAMAGRRYPTEQRRAQIAEAALDLLGRTSLDAVTTREVARVVGISQPAIFRHFRSREALLVEVVEHARVMLSRQVERLLSAGPISLDVVVHVAETLLDFVEAHPGLPRLLFAEAPDASAELAAALGRLQGMPRALVAELLRDEERVGRTRRGLAEVGADSFLGLMQGTILSWQRRGRPPGLRARARPLMNVWMHGVVAPGAQVPDTSGPAPVAPEPPEEARPLLLELDVRPQLAQGEEPLELILDAVRGLAADGVLVLTSPFLPRPLLALLAGRGHSTHATQMSERAWSTVVRLGGGDILDLTEREPPEPIEAILRAVADGALPVVARVPRYPVLLLERLATMGQAVGAARLEDGTAVVRVGPS